MNEEEKKETTQEQLFDLGNGRFVDINKLIQVAQQEGNQDLYTSSWSLGSRRNAIKTSINETLQAIKDGYITGRNANKSYNFNKDVLQQTGKHYDPNSHALDYLNWLVDSDKAPEDFFTQPKLKEEPKKEGPKKYTGSYEGTISSLYPSMEVWNDRDRDDNTQVISGNTNRISQAVEAAQKHLMENKGYDFSESLYYKNEKDFEEAMNAIIEAGRNGNMDDLIAAIARTGGFKGVNIRDTYFGIPKVEKKPDVVETEEQKAYREKQEQYKLFQEQQNRNKEMAKMDWDMGYYNNNIVPNFTKFANTSKFPTLLKGELLPYYAIPKVVGKDKEDTYKATKKKFAINAYNTLLKYLSGIPVQFVQNEQTLKQWSQYLDWFFDPNEKSNKEFGRGYYWNPEMINKDNAHFYVYNPETRSLLVKSFDEANDEIKAILEEHHRNKFYNNYGKKLNGGTLSKLKQLRKGGIIKAQNGREINWVYESDYNKTKKKEKINDPNWVIATDSVGALFDLASLVMSFTGVGSLSSAVPGAIGSALDFFGNWGRDGLDWRDARNFAINLGSDALGMVPGLGVSSKVAKVSKALPTIITSLAALNVGQDSLNILKKVQDNNGDWSVVSQDDWSNLAQSVLPAIGGIGRMVGNRKASNRILAGIDRGKTREEALNIIEEKTKGATKGGARRIKNFTQENKKFEDQMDDLFSSTKIQTPKTRLDELKEISTKFKSNALSKWEADGGSVDKFDEMFKHLVQKGKSEKEALDFISKEMKSNTIDNVFNRVMEVKTEKNGGKLNQLKALRKGGILKFQNPAGTLPQQFLPEELKYFKYAGIDPSQYGSVSEFRNSDNYLQYLNSEFNPNQVLKEQASKAIEQTVNPSDLGSSGTGSAGTWRHVGGVKHFDGTNYTNAAMQNGLSMLTKMDPSKRQAGIEALKAAGNNTEAWNQAFNTHFGDINKNIVGYDPEVDNYNGASTQFRQNLIKNFSQFIPEEEDSDINPTNDEILNYIDTESEALHTENPNLAAEIKALRNPKEESFEDTLQTYQRNAAGKRPNAGGEDQYKKVSGLYDLAQLGIKNKAISDYAKDMSDLYQNNIYDAQYHQDQLKNVTNWLSLRNKQEKEHADQVNMIQQMGGTDAQSNRQALLALFKQQQDDKTNLNIQEKRDIDQQISDNIDIANNNAKLRVEDSNDLQKNTLAANITSGSILAEANKAIQSNLGDYITQLKLNKQQDVKDWNAALYTNEVDKAGLDYQNAVNYANLHLADDPAAWQEYVNKAANALANVQNEQRNKMYGFKTKQIGPNYGTLSAKKGGKLDSDTKIQIENSRFLSKQIIQQLKNRDRGLDRLSKITYKTILKSLGLE